MGDLQWRELVHLSEQLHSVREAVVAAGRKVDCQQMKKLTDSVNGRLVIITEKKGGCMNVLGKHSFYIELHINSAHYYLPNSAHIFILQRKPKTNFYFLKF